MDVVYKSGLLIIKHFTLDFGLIIIYYPYNFKQIHLQYAETLVQSLLYNVEQVFYTSCTQEHIAELCTELLRLFNTTPGDPSTHSLAVRYVTKPRGS